MADPIDFTPYLEPKLVQFAPSTTTTPLVTRSGPWYTYTRAATPGELATGKSENTAYDLEMLAKCGNSYDEYAARERPRLAKKGIHI